MLQSAIAAMQLEGVETPAFEALFDAVCATFPEIEDDMRNARILRLREVRRAIFDEIAATKDDC